MVIIGALYQSREMDKKVVDGYFRIIQGNAEKLACILTSYLTAVAHEIFNYMLFHDEALWIPLLYGYTNQDLSRRL